MLSRRRRDPAVTLSENRRIGLVVPDAFEQHDPKRHHRIGVARRRQRAVLRRRLLRVEAVKGEAGREVEARICAFGLAGAAVDGALERRQLVWLWLARRPRARRQLVPVIFVLFPFPPHRRLARPEALELGVHGGRNLRRLAQRGGAGGAGRDSGGRRAEQASEHVRRRSLEVPGGARTPRRRSATVVGHNLRCSRSQLFNLAHASTRSRCGVDTALNGRPRTRVSRACAAAALQPRGATRAHATAEYFGFCESAAAQSCATRALSAAGICGFCDNRRATAQFCSAYAAPSHHSAAAGSADGARAAHAAAARLGGGAGGPSAARALQFAADRFGDAQLHGRARPRRAHGAVAPPPAGQ